MFYFAKWSHFGTGKRFAEDPKPQCCCWAQLLFVIDNPWAGNRICVVVRMCFSYQSKSNLVKINAFISSHVLSNKGRDFYRRPDWRESPKLRLRIFVNYGCCCFMICSLFSGVFQAFCCSVDTAF